MCFGRYMIADAILIFIQIPSGFVLKAKGGEVMGIAALIMSVIALVISTLNMVINARR